MAPSTSDDDAPAGMRGYGPSTYGDGFADVYDEWYADVSPPEGTARFIADRSSGPVLELGSGTGRLAAPLRDAGVPVVGLDASSSMLSRSVRQHPDVPVVAADMAELPVRDGSFGAVLVAFNTLFNLPTPALQRRCLTQARTAVRDDGIVVVEAFVPGSGAEEATDRVDVVRLDADVVVLRVSRTEPEHGTVSGHHVELRDGQPVRLRPWQVCFATPDALDEMAAAAGLEVHERHADWTGGAFDASSDTHVTVYRVAGGSRGRG